MKVERTLFTFLAGVASGLALAYYADPKGSQKKLKSIEKSIEKQVKKTRQTVDHKLDEYKHTAKGLVDKYSAQSQEMLNQLKTLISQNGEKASAALAPDKKK